GSARRKCLGVDIPDGESPALRAGMEQVAWRRGQGRRSRTGLRTHWLECDPAAAAAGLGHAVERLLATALAALESTSRRHNHCRFRDDVDSLRQSPNRLAMALAFCAPRCRETLRLQWSGPPPFAPTAGSYDRHSSTSSVW